MLKSTKFALRGSDDYSDDGQLKYKRKIIKSAKKGMLYLAFVTLSVNIPGTHVKITYLRENVSRNVRLDNEDIVKFSKSSAELYRIQEYFKEILPPQSRAVSNLAQKLK